jgi:hypothetical protein
MALGGSHEEYIIINNTLLTGVQNVAFSQQVSEDPVLAIGSRFNGTTVTSPTITTLAIDKLLLNSDFITGLTGSSSISGQFGYGDNLIDFEKACLGDYSVSAQVGSLPTIAFNLDIYGSLSGSESSVELGAVNENSIQKVPQEGLIVTFDKGATNAVQSVVFTQTINKQAMYGINSFEVAQVKTVGPISQQVQISIEVEDYELEETFSFLEVSKDRNRTIQIQISGENSILNTFTLENAHLTSESFSAGVGDTIIANLEYKGYKKV